MPKCLFDLRDQVPLLDIVSYGRRAQGTRPTFSSAERDYIGRTVRGTPEVMIKVSGGGQSVGAVAAHLRYIDRKGELDLETDEGDRISGKGIEHELLDDWGLEEQQANSTYSGMPGRKPTKLVHNIVFSTLREWRRDFAAALRMQGVAANATERAVRGAVRSHKTDGIYRAMRRGESTHLEERALAVARELRGGQLNPGPGKDRLLSTRRDVERGWRAVSNLLEREGDTALALQVRRFVERMLPPQTEREWIAGRMLEQVRDRAHARPRIPDRAP